MLFCFAAYLAGSFGLLRFYILATSKDRHQLASLYTYSAAPLEDQAANTMTQYLTQLQYHNSAN